jgi:hypothetical protein
MLKNLKIVSKDIIYRLSFIKQCLHFMPNFKSQGLKIAVVQCIRHHVYDFIDFLLVWHLPVHFPRQKVHSDSSEIHGIVTYFKAIKWNFMSNSCYLLPHFPHEGVHEHICYICSFYSFTNTTSRKPAVLTLVW